MQEKQIEHAIATAKASLDHPLFYPRIFALTARQRKKNEEASPSHIIIEEYEELSRRLDRSQIQESVSVRNVLRTRSLSAMLIDEKGELRLDLLPDLIHHLKANLYSLGPQRQNDGKRQEHILKVLDLILNQKDLVRALKKVSTPISNKNSEDLIRQTLQLPQKTVLTDAHIRRAVLSAWLCYLRQNVGSCFATAPAEIIHDEQPELFLQDLLDLITTGTLKRTFSGIENAVPFSVSWGSGDLKKPLVISISDKEISPEIWYSPGLLAAFEEVEILNKEDPLKDKIQQIEKWIKSLVLKSSSQSYCILTAEEIIRNVLMQLLGITEKQIAEYENRPRPMLQSQLIMQVPIIKRNNGSVADRCAHFLQIYEVAKNTFKSLADNALLKAWEFTLASFSDIKYEFARWNFYSSLGMQTNEPGGIGQCIHGIIQHKLDQANRKVQEIQYEYETVFTQVKTLESRMRSASTEKELQWLKVDYQSRRNEFYFLEEQRAAAQDQASSLVNLYDTLYKLYVDLFKDYFQEVYDADMHEVSTGPFDDSPAGFRLLYKHGRSNTSQWTRIQNHNEFIESLAAFFVATEPQLAHALEGQNVEKDLGEVVTGIIHHVKTKEFLESAFHRMAAAHQAPLIKNPLDHMDKIEKKPWVYTSGGTMNTLLSGYYRIEDKPKDVDKWVESEMELLVFLADAIKHIPNKLLEPFLNGTRKSLLMQSPTHAFLLQPMTPLFKDAWTTEEFTYTYVRDRFVHQQQMFIQNLLLNNDMIDYLLAQLMSKIPVNFQHRFKNVARQIIGPLNPMFFRDALVELFEHDRGLRYGSRAVLSNEEIDSLLYSHLPLCPIYELRERVKQIYSLLPGFSASRLEKMMHIFDQIPLRRGEYQFLGAQQLQDICKALLCLSESRTTSALDYHLLISNAAQKLEFAMPPPIIFADTNWVKNMFGFTVNPGTGKFELWRMDYIGSNGYPMAEWKQWLNGTRSDRRWVVYVKPYEYGQS